MTAVHLIGIPLTGTSVNPARSLGPAITVAGTALSQVWLFIVAPCSAGRFERVKTARGPRVVERLVLLQTRAHADLINPIGFEAFLAAEAAVRRHFAPHQLRHAHTVQMAHKEVPPVVTQPQHGHPNPSITSIYLQGIDGSEIISTVHGRPPPTISANAGLQITQ